jgi:hypothetical protein
VPSSVFKRDPEPAPPAPVPKHDAKASTRDPGSLFVSGLLIAAALLALASVLLAALPLEALERLLAVEAHYGTEQVVDFVDGHRLDIAVAGLATLLVAAVVAIPTVTG